MTIKEVSEKFNITPDTLRYYEKVGVIPKVHRTSGGKRDFTESDISWVQTMKCFRSAGVPIDMLIEYRELFEEGNKTFEARCNLLKRAKEKLLEERKRYDDALEKLTYKIDKYEEACITGELNWEDEHISKDGACK